MVSGANWGATVIARSVDKANKTENKACPAWARVSTISAEIRWRILRMIHSKGAFFISDASVANRCHPAKDGADGGYRTKTGNSTYG